MDFFEALKKVINGKQVFNDNIVNGVNERLVIVCGCPFVSVPRQLNAKTDNFILQPLSAEKILNTKWSEI